MLPAAHGRKEMSFGRDTRVIPSNILLGGPQSPTGRGDFGVSTPTYIAKMNQPIERDDAT